MIFTALGSQESLSVILPKKFDCATVTMAAFVAHCAGPDAGQIVTPLLGLAVIGAGVGAGVGVGLGVALAAEPPIGGVPPPSEPLPGPPPPPQAASRNEAAATHAAEP